MENDKFDLIICYHILEHIIEDMLAMKELFRVLKPKGKIIIQTPFLGETIYEDYSINTPELRLKHFGQKDHVRIYAAQGLETA
ncbi:MAG: methyltransferase domain-containing protein [Saprospiraceae bacterium]|nr:methyltransferase domain-containing protein [Saprospiraceae bacterium]